MSEFIKHYCNYYNIPNPEDEPEDPFFEQLTYKFDYFAKDLKTYCMTYYDMTIYTDKSYSYLTKKIPEYVENGTLIRDGSKNSAKFVLPKYEQLYINAKKVEPLADLRSFIDPTIYIDKLQLTLTPSNTYGDKLYKERQQFSPSNPIKIFGRLKNQLYYFTFLCYKSGKIIIYVDFKTKLIYADFRNFVTLFNNLRQILSIYHNSTTSPHSFIISQFEGHREPFDKSFKIKINTTQSFNLSQLLYYLNNI